jgi:hypothetical protein
MPASGGVGSRGRRVLMAVACIYGECFRWLSKQHNCTIGISIHLEIAQKTGIALP